MAADGPDAASTGGVADAAGKTVASTFGEIVWLMSQSAEHKTIPIGDLETLVMPAILLRQFRLFYEGERPVAAVLYARVSEEVAARIELNQAPLTPAEWQSGSRSIVVSIIAPFGNAEVFRAEVER